MITLTEKEYNKIIKGCTYIDSNKKDFSIGDEIIMGYPGSNNFTLAKIVNIERIKYQPWKRRIYFNIKAVLGVD